MARGNPEYVRRAFLSSRPEQERLVAYHLYCEIKGPGYKEVVLKALTDESVPIRAAAVHGLRSVRAGDELIALYVRLLGDTSYWVRYNAAEALEKHPSPQAVEPLLRLLGDPSIETRHRAACTLLKWKLAQAGRGLEESRESSNLTVAGAANVALAWHLKKQVDRPVVHSYLEQELKALDGPPYSGTDNVVAIIHVLRDQGDASSLSVLEAALRHKHRYVQKEAGAAIEVIRRRCHPVGDLAPRGP